MLSVLKGGVRDVPQPGARQAAHILGKLFRKLWFSHIGEEASHPSAAPCPLLQAAAPPAPACTSLLLQPWSNEGRAESHPPGAQEKGRQLSRGS